MKKNKHQSRGYRPWSAGLILLLGLGTGCGDTNRLSTDSASQQPELAINQQTDEALEELPPDVLARAANVYPAAVRQASTNAQGQQANSTSNYASLSANGKYVAFVSKATNLGQQNPTSQYQVYRKNLETGEIICLSRGSSWDQAGNGQSTQPRISDDGSLVAFSSKSNLVYGVDTSPGTYNVYLARFFPEYTGAPSGEFQTELLTYSRGDNSYLNPRVAAGDSTVRDFAGNNYLCLRSNAADLVPDDQDTKWDLFFSDVSQRGSNAMYPNYPHYPYVELWSRNNSYNKGNQNSLNAGLYSDQVQTGMFMTSATNIIPSGATRPGLAVRENQYYVRHQPMGARKVRDVDVAEQNRQRFVITANNATNNGYEVYFYSSQYPGDQNFTEIKLASQTRSDDSIAISDDGRFVVYEDLSQRTELSDTDTLYDIYLYDARDGKHYLVSKNSASSSHAYRPTISDDGGTIAWDQGGRIWVTGNPALGSTPPNTPQTVSSTQAGVTSNGGWQGVMGPAISADGRYLTFSSDATNLSTEVTSSKYHTYRKDLYTGELLLVSRQNGTNLPAESETTSLISDDGKSVIFDSRRTDLGTVFPPSSNFFSTYARNIETGSTKFMFTKGRALDLVASPWDPTQPLLYFTSYGTSYDYPYSYPRNVLETELTNNYPRQIPGVPSWMAEQHGVDRVKVSDNAQKLTILLSDTQVSPNRYKLYQVNHGYYYLDQPRLISDNVDFQNFDVSGDGNTVAYTERYGSAFDRFLVVRRLDQPYSGYQMVTHTQATHPDLSSDGRYLLYFDTNMAPGQNQGSGSNAYVFDTQTQIKLPVRQQRVSFPGSLRLSDDGRSVVFEDTDASGNTQLFVVKNPHL